MLFDPFTILTDGMHELNNGLLNGFLAVVSITVTPPVKPPVIPAPVLRTGGGTGYDPTYRPPHFEPPVPQPVKSVEEIASLLHEFQGESVVINLAYTGKRKRNIQVECQLLEHRVTAKLEEAGSKNVQVKIIYNPDNK